MTKIQLKRAYDPPAATDGFRVLVDRLWPRGLTKEAMPYDLWAKNLAPSNNLRKWFHEDPDERWPEFKKQYLSELKLDEGLDEFITTIKKQPTVTLVFGAKDTRHNQAEILKEYLETLLKA